MICWKIGSDTELLPSLLSLFPLFQGLGQDQDLVKNQYCLCAFSLASALFLLEVKL